MQAELIIAGCHELAEGPVWYADALHWVDIRAGNLHRWNPVSGIREHRHLGAPLGNAVPTTDGRWLAAHKNTLALHDWATGQSEDLCTPESPSAPNRFNDGKCDPCGRWCVGSMSATTVKAPTAALYSYQSTGLCHTLLTGLTISNGLGWSPDGRRFFHTDSWTRRIDVYAYDLATGTISDSRTLARISEKDGLPDGLTVDAEGHLWVALWGGGAVLRLDGHDGRELARVTLPVTQVTSCTFGGPALDELYITTVTAGLSGPQLAAQRTAGGIFRAHPGVAGLPVTPAQIDSLIPTPTDHKQ